MKITFNESQCKICLLSIRCLTAATAALLHDDERGQSIMDAASSLMHKIGPAGENLANADLNDDEKDTFLRALNAMHFIYVLSETIKMNDDDKQHTLRVVRQCMTAFS